MLSLRASVQSAANLSAGFQESPFPSFSYFSFRGPRDKEVLEWECREQEIREVLVCR